MQWLSAILAFATTMLIFAVIVSTLVETIGRFLGSRVIALRTMLGCFYDHVIAPLVGTPKTGQSKEDFIKLMSVARTPSNASATQELPSRYSFKALTVLPVATFMERLGSSDFAAAIKHDTKDGEQALMDIAHKYENFGHEASAEFESKARVFSVLVAMFVSVLFYVHPYDLWTTYLQEPAVANKVAEFADDPIKEYEQLIQKTQTLQTQSSALSEAKFNELLSSIEDDLNNTREQVTTLSEAGAPLGWPDNTNLRNLGAKNTFWLIMGGLLIGLGAPFWAKFVQSVVQAQSTSKNIAQILQPQHAVNNNAQAATPRSATPTSSNASESQPMSTTAFTASATRKSMEVAPAPNTNNKP